MTLKLMQAHQSKCSSTRFWIRLITLQRTNYIPEMALDNNNTCFVVYVFIWIKTVKYLFIVWEIMENFTVVRVYVAVITASHDQSWTNDVKALICVPVDHIRTSSTVYQMLFQDLDPFRLYLN